MAGWQGVLLFVWWRPSQGGTRDRYHGHTTAAGFPVDSAPARARFYVLANWSYQGGVFLSRSSGMLYQVRCRWGRVGVGGAQGRGSESHTR